MAVTVKTAWDSWASRPFRWVTGKDGAHTLQGESDLYVVLKKGESESTYTFRFKKGFKCDGLSVPWLFRWFLPSWDEKNWLYNLAGAVHDWLYATKGAYGRFTRSECDDIFRGLMRGAGIGRFKAGTADLSVGLFAWCGRHWGNDSYRVGGLVQLVC